MAGLLFGLPQPLSPTSSPTFDSVFLNSAITSPNQSATKAYVDAFASGFNPLANCQWATTSELIATYNNGVSGLGATLTLSAVGQLFIDGGTPSVGDRILVKNQSNTAYNGIYSVTISGSVITNAQLTRSTDYDQASEMINSSSTFIENGVSNYHTEWVQTSANVVTVGTSPLIYLKYGGTFGDVSGPTSAMPDSVPIFSGPTGKIIKNTAVLIDPGSNNFSTPGSITTSSNLILNGVSKRILGDFTNNIDSIRVLFKTSTTNGVSTIGAIPDGVGLGARYRVYSLSDPDNSGFFELSSTILPGINISHTGTGITYQYFDVRFDGNTQFKVENTVGGVNYLSAKGSLTTAAVSLNAVGADTNISINLVPKGTGDVLINGSIAGVYGQYTPNLTNVANISASSANQCQYSRVGNVITVSGSVSITVTLAATLTKLGISLPVSSIISSATQCAGTAACPTIASNSAAILGDTANGRGELDFTSTSTGVQIFYFNFSYFVL